jgi:hypothetical protein
MKPVQAFMTTDGLIFTSQEEAEQHEADLAILPTIDAFLNSTANTYHGRSSEEHRSVGNRPVGEMEKRQCLMTISSRSLCTAKTTTLRVCTQKLTFLSLHESSRLTSSLTLKRRTK